MSSVRLPRPSSEFIRFVITGGLAACVNVAVRIPLGWVMAYSASIVVAYLIGMSTAFILARLFVFQPSQRSMVSEYARFAIVNCASLLQVLLVSLFFDKMLFPWWAMTWHRATIAHAIGVASPVVTSYYGHKFFSFRKPSLKCDLGLS